MPYTSSLFTFLGEQLRQPTWWAAIASVGIHGMLGVSTPVLSVFYPPQKPPGKVEVVELTPAEMSRLPQTFPAQISSPKFNLSPIPAPPNVVSPLPPGPSDLQFSSLPPGMSSFLPPRSSLSQLNSPPPSNDVPFTPPPKRPLPTSRRPQPSQPNPSTDKRLDQTTPLPSPKVPSRNGDMSSNDGSSFADRPGAKPRTPKFWDQAVATVDRNSGRNSESSDDIRRNFHPNSNQSSPPNQPQQPGISNESSQTLEANKNSLIAYNEMVDVYRKPYPALETTKVITLDTPYPKAACSGKLQGITVLGVFVNPQGQIAANPKVLASTNQPILDNAALAAVKVKPFETASNPKLYLLKVEFKYDEKTCGLPPVAPSPSPKPSPTPQLPKSSPTPQPPKSSPKPSPTPQTQPSAQPSLTPTPTQPTPTPTSTPSPTPTPTPTQPSPTPTPTPETSSTPTPEPSLSPTPETSPTPTPETSPTPTPEPSLSPTPSNPTKD